MVVQSFPNCTKHYEYGHFHISYQDFIDIAGDLCNASALRVFEMKTDRRVAELRARYGLAENILPHEDDLWLTVSLADLEQSSLYIYCHSSYARSVAEETKESEPWSLVELGLLRRRYIARPADERAIGKPLTTIFYDRQGAFIVTNAAGEYRGIDGQAHTAWASGYSRIEHQFLYCIEVVNREIAAFYDEEEPEPMQRAAPLIRHKEPKSATNDPRETTKFPRISSGAPNAVLILSAQGGTSKTDVTNTTSFACYYNAAPHGVSSNPPDTEQNILPSIPLADDLRSAPWTPQTLLQLSSAILAVPDPASCDQEEWKREWEEPARWIIEHLRDSDPRFAWERVERHLRGMTDPSSPSWWLKRAKPTPITLRHVVGRDRATSRFTGHNWRVVEAELDKAGWYSNQATPYDGPPLYETGYGGIVTITEVSPAHEAPAPSEPSVKEAPMPGLFMPAFLIEQLESQILEEHPDIRRDQLRRYLLTPGRYLLDIAYAPGSYLRLECPVDYSHPTSEVSRRLDEAIEYGQRLREQDVGQHEFD